MEEKEPTDLKFAPSNAWLRFRADFRTNEMNPAYGLVAGTFSLRLNAEKVKYDARPDFS